ALITINLIVSNSERESKYIPYLFASLRNQTFTDWQMNVLDNHSDGEVVSLVEKELANLGKKYEITKSQKNLGFAEGHNLLYRRADTAYVLMLNPDMYLLPDVLAKLAAFMQEHQEVATVSARLMRWDFASVQAKQEAAAGFTDFIDAIGIRLLRNRRAVEWLAQQEWRADSPDKNVSYIFPRSIVEVFGVSGALPLFRKKAIDQTLLPGDNIFDPTYHSYKEDLDLAYRLRNLGFTSYVILNAVAYHDRRGAAPKQLGDWAAIRNHRRQSHYVRFHSYKNHLRTLYKNEYWQNLAMDWPYIFWFELKKFTFLLVTDPMVIIRGWYELARDFGYTFRARRAIIKGRKLYWRGLRRWF
ncbi:MAG TPA: glycosyltransferase, partial [Patescibacteria group bacterium]|nr:glycosyltransferase [Patescibacteria group bacterium]